MKIKQIYTDHIDETAYYIESDGEAAVINPLRKSNPYLKHVMHEDEKMKYVFETHFHDDFISGHIDFIDKSGAKIVFGPAATPEYEAYIAKDGELFQIGKLTIKVLHTPPGHAMESTTYLLYDETGKEYATFSGNTPGKQQLSNNASDKKTGKKELTGEVLKAIVLPSRSSPVRESIDYSRNKNPGIIIGNGNPPLDVETFKALMEQKDMLVIDCRHETEFGNGHIPGSRFIKFDESFAVSAGILIKDMHQKILLVAPRGRELEALTRLSDVGFNQVLGHLEGGFESWLENGEIITMQEHISAKTYALHYRRGIIKTIDCRKPSEYNAQHIVNAIHFPVESLFENLSVLDKKETYYVHCAEGYRSMSAISILKANGYDSLVNIDGGFDAITQTDIPTTSYVCTSTSEKMMA